VVTPDHSANCACAVCTLVRIYAGSTPDSDAKANRDMTDAWESIEAVLSDEARVTSSDRDNRPLAAE
jgi:hypothetical protein